MMDPKNDFLDVIPAALYDSMSEPKVVVFEGGRRETSQHAALFLRGTCSYPRNK